jgi:MFS family permease
MAADRYGYRWVTVTTAGLMGIGFILGSLVQTAWQMYLFIGILPGIGACAAIPLPLAIVTRWFIKRRGLALGISSAGIGTGAAIIPLLIAYLISEIGWRAAFAVLGGLILASYLPIMLFIIRIPDEDYVSAYDGEEPARPVNPGMLVKQGSLSLLQAVATKSFWLIFAVFGLCILSLALALTHIVPHALDKGLSAMTAASMLTILGFCSIFGRLAAGAVSDRTGAKPVLYTGLLLQAIMMLWVSMADTLWMFYLFAVLFGIAYGGILVMIPRLTASTFGAESMGSVYSGISVGDGVGFAIGPFLAGVLFDISGTYNLSFWLVAFGLFAAVWFTVMLKEG